MTRIAGKGELKVLVAGVGMIRVKSQRPAKFTSYFYVNSRPTFLWKLPPKSQKLMTSVFCSNTLIFASECWTCTLRGPDLKICPEVMLPDPTSNLRFQLLQVTSVALVFPFHAYFKAFIPNYYVSESWVRKMNGILHSDWLPEWKRWGLSYPFMMVPQGKSKSFWPYNKYFIDQASWVMMAE